jgi:CubicO group peptidase (beta-lactamase class C family)
LGRIIAAVSGLDWPDFFATRLFGPLGMDSTRVILDMDSALEAKVTGYIRQDGQYRRCLSWNPAWANAAGGVITTPVDMARWTAAFYNDRLLPTAVMQTVWSPTRLADGEPLKVGFGWNVDEDDSGQRRHTGYGGGPGISSHICTYVDTKVSLALFSNIGDVQGPLADLAKNIASRILPLS